MYLMVVTGREISSFLRMAGIAPTSREHRGRAVVLLQFAYEPVVTVIIKRFGGRWSQAMNGWYVPRSKSLLVRLVDELALHKQFETRKVAWKELVRLLELKSYSGSTIRTYGNAFQLFLDHIDPRPAEALTRGEIEAYLHGLAARGASETVINTTINAIKFYLEKVLGKDKELYDLPRPRKPLQLPKVLGEHELRRLFNAVGNRKHKAILFTAYSAGLRVSEVVQLKLAHVDSDRMQLFIERSKGKKDRYVGLSPVLLDVLRGYYKACQPRPQVYVFEGRSPGEPYSARSAQVIFQRARAAAGIQKSVSFHALRHSFATHLLEKGIDIRYIKELLGHFNIHTTERYLHVRRDHLVHVENPLDRLWAGGDIHWD